MEIKLTEYARKCGCGAKLSSKKLSEVLEKLPKVHNENLIVGTETSDDAGVYKLNDQMAIIQTVDFFTPIVDDPYTFGVIAATNALSDVYAMGGDPVTALNIVCFPNRIDLSVLGEILRGGIDKAKEAGAIIVGGHTIEDEEPKYGMAVTGIISPDKVLKNYGARVGEVLILTKPLGIGIISTAMKSGKASDHSKETVIKSMTTLNKYSSEIIRKYNISACTDVTGFGLMGHSYEMASSSGVTIVLEKEKIPYIKEAEEYSKQGLVPGGMFNNMEYLKGKYEFIDIPEYLSNIVFDPQTSGGLLISCSREDAPKILEELNELEIKSHIIGTVTEKQEKSILFK